MWSRACVIHNYYLILGANIVKSISQKIVLSFCVIIVFESVVVIVLVLAV